MDETPVNKDLDKWVECLSKFFLNKLPKCSFIENKADADITASTLARGGAVLSFDGL